MHAMLVFLLFLAGAALMLLGVLLGLGGLAGMGAGSGISNTVGVALLAQAGGSFGMGLLLWTVGYGLDLLHDQRKAARETNELLRQLRNHAVETSRGGPHG